MSADDWTWYVGPKYWVVELLTRGALERYAEGALRSGAYRIATAVSASYDSLKKAQAEADRRNAQTSWEDRHRAGLIYMVWDDHDIYLAQRRGTTIVGLKE
jgi:hypothetical protein